jgi:hypothetical protein
MSGNRTQLGWLGVNPQTVPSSHRAKNPLVAVLIWIIVLTPRVHLRLFPKRLTNVGCHCVHLLNCLFKLLGGSPSSLANIGVRKHCGH